MQQIVLYDLKGAPTQTWAPNVSRVRCILNFKRLPFITIPLDLHDVENQMRSIGAPPTSYRQDRKPVYTLPVLVDPNRSTGTHANGHSHGHGNGYGHPQENGYRTPHITISNVNLIVEYLEATYPARPVFPEGSRAMQTLVVHYIQDVFIQPLLPIMVPISQPQLGGGGHKGYPPGANGGMNGGPMMHHEEGQWRQVKAQFDFLATILDKNSSDTTLTYAQGRDVTYADLALCSVLAWIKKVAGRDSWAQVKKWGNGRWGRLYDRCKDYIEE
ncbi:hypothetical protein JOM56_009298 [Amanita muscaria]